MFMKSVKREYLRKLRVLSQICRWTIIYQHTRKPKSLSCWVFKKYGVSIRKTTCWKNLNIDFVLHEKVKIKPNKASTTGEVSSEIFNTVKIQQIQQLQQIQMQQIMITNESG